ncbi:MAG TPA: CHASE3 domain-containing protein [Methylibium sp.]|uniref:CHASE3 domain-containing protein n=1 Tax=Methylibium sp. TaxID=2067992 RepID=UPI002DBAF7C7|nr:CHASE3 domain-containing protein [Methylibium sp.]HEU4457576.1 CHASE3 domain-containing protein [Methylibium sp.]
MKLPMVERPEPVRVLGWSFALAAITALALLVISETSYRRSMAALEETESLYENRSEIGRVLRYTIDAETSQRGFLLTGSDDYLRPYREANRQMSVSLEKLAAHVRRYPVEADAYSKLFVLTRTRMTELAETMELYQQGRHDAWRAIVESGIGKENQDRIRDQIFAIVDLENRRLARYQKQVTQSLLISRLGVATLTVLSVLAFYFYLRQTRALMGERERQRAVLQQERDHLEAQVRRRTEDLSSLTRNLQTTQEAERSRLARELHDELGALFTSAKLDVARLQARLGPATPEVAERLKHLIAALNSGVELKRRIIEDLRPSALGHFGLKASLDILAREFAQRSGLAVDAQIAPVSLGEEQDLTVYRLVQESLTNIAKYAQAKRVEIRVAEREHGVELLVGDDGHGFDPAQVRRGAHGLSGMRFRVEAAGGRMSVVTGSGQGTRVQAWLPAATAPAETAAAA